MSRFMASLVRKVQARKAKESAPEESPEQAESPPKRARSRVTTFVSEEAAARLAAQAASPAPAAPEPPRSTPQEDPPEPGPRRGRPRASTVLSEDAAERLVQGDAAARRFAATRRASLEAAMQPPPKDSGQEDPLKEALSVKFSKEELTALTPEQLKEEIKRLQKAMDMVLVERAAVECAYHDSRHGLDLRMTALHRSFAQCNGALGGDSECQYEATEER